MFVYGFPGSKLPGRLCASYTCQASALVSTPHESMRIALTWTTMVCRRSLRAGRMERWRYATRRPETQLPSAFIVSKAGMIWPEARPDVDYRFRLILSLHVYNTFIHPVVRNISPIDYPDALPFEVQVDDMKTSFSQAQPSFLTRVVQFSQVKCAGWTCSGWLGFLGLRLSWFLLSGCLGKGLLGFRFIVFWALVWVL